MAKTRVCWLAIVATALAAGCATSASYWAPASARSDPSVLSSVDSSAFLAARFSTLTGDHQSAAYYFRKMAMASPADAEALDRAVVSGMLALQDFEAAETSRDAPSTTIAAAPFASVLLAASEMGAGRPAKARAAAKLSPRGPVNEDIAWAIAVAAGDAAAELPATIRPEDRALVHALMQIAAGATIPFDSASASTATPAPRRSWIPALEARLLGLSGDREKAAQIVGVMLSAGDTDMETAVAQRQLVSGYPPIGRMEALAAAVFLMADAATPPDQPELRLVYAGLALTIDPGFEPARFTRMDALEKLSRFDEAQLQASYIPPASPRYADAQMRRAELRFRKGDKVAAMAALSAVDWGVQRRELTLRAGDLYRSLDRNADAERQYASIIQTDRVQGREDWRPLLARADVLRRMRRVEDADLDLAAAFALAPSDPDVMNDRAFAWVEAGENLDAALALLKWAHDLRPGDPSILDSLGWAHFRVGDLAAAAEHLERAAELAPIRPDILEHLGEVYAAMGRPADAAHEWRRALEFATEQTRAERLRNRLAMPSPAPPKTLGTDVETTGAVGSVVPAPIAEPATRP